MIAENAVQMRNTLVEAIDPIIRQMAKNDDVAYDVLADLIPEMDRLVRDIGEAIQNKGINAFKENRLSRDFVRQSKAKEQPSVEAEIIKAEEMYELVINILPVAVDQYIEQAHNALTPLQCFVVLARKLLGARHSHIAGCLNKSEGSIRKAYSLGTKRLKEGGI